MTENPIVAMANKFRDAIGTKSKFTLSEISQLAAVPLYYPASNPTSTLDINGIAQSGAALVDVHGGDTLTYTFKYNIATPKLLRKLVGSKAYLSLTLPLVKYTNPSTYVATTVAQTIKILKNDGTELFSPITINDGNTDYAYVNLKRKEPLTNELVDYLITNQPIKAQYTNVGSHDGSQINSTAVLAFNLYQVKNQG